MDVMTLIAAGGLSDVIGKFIYNTLYGWVSGWASDWGIVGAFSVTVIMFTLFLKVLVLPFDIWQKQLARNNAKKMKKMKPELDKITKQCGSNKEMLMQKQRALYKKYKYSTFGACLPMIITLVIFFIVFGGYNSAVRLHNKTTYENLENTYVATYNEERLSQIKTLAESKELDLSKIDEIMESGEMKLTELRDYVGWTDEEEKTIIDSATAKANQAVLDNYKSERFLLTKNIFVSDNWKKPVPSASDFTGTGMGGAGVTGIDTSMYETVMKPVMDEYNNGWNGYLILPVLVLILNVLSMFLNKPAEQPQVAGQTEEQQKAQQSQMKIMQFIMPVMMLVFALFYSAAFTLYMFVNSFITTIFNLLFNIITKRIDAKEEDRELSLTVKK